MGRAWGVGGVSKIGRGLREWEGVEPQSGRKQLGWVGLLSEEGGSSNGEWMGPCGVGGASRGWVCPQRVSGATERAVPAGVGGVMQSGGEPTGVGGAMGYGRSQQDGWEQQLGAMPIRWGQ